MAISRGPRIINNGLVLCLDAANRNSYSGTDTTWNDVGGFDCTGTLTNGPTFNSSNLGNIVFDGNNDFVDVTNTAANFGFANTSFTVSIWYRQSSLSNGALISKNGATSGWSVWTVFDGTIVSYMKNGSSSDNYTRFTSSVVSPNTWLNIVSVFTTSTTVAGNNSIINYVNGVVNAGTVTTTSLTYGTDTSSNIFLGRRTTTPYLNGSIASVHIYNRGLSASEVLFNYNATKSRFGL